MENNNYEISDLPYLINKCSLSFDELTEAMIAILKPTNKVIKELKRYGIDINGYKGRKERKNNH